MATIRKRGDSYQIDYYDPDGKRVRKSFKKKKDARLELAAREISIEDGTYFEKGRVYTTTFDELLERYRENYKDQRSYERSKRYMLEALEEEFTGELLRDITYLKLETYRNKLKNTLTKDGRIRSDATVNRYMACLRHIMARAVIWGMLKENPFKKGDPLQSKEDNKRDRFLTEEEIPRLLAECPVQEAPRQKGRLIQGSQAIHLRDFIIISLNTGMQKSEVLSLKWDQIKRGLIYLPKIKTRPARQIPVNNDLANHFKSIKRKQAVGSKYVVSDSKGRPIKDIKTAFASALNRAGIQDFRPHDLRHTFASHYMMRGGKVPALAKILGHTKITTTMRYAHLSPEYTEREMDRVNGLTSGKKKEDGLKMVTSSLSKKAVAS